MKNTRRRLSVLVVLALFVCSMGLGACALAEDGVTLRLIWHGDGMNKEFLDESLKGYTEKTGTAIETIFIPGGWGEYFTKIQTMIAGGESADAAIVAVEGFDMFQKMGLGLPINDWIRENQAKYDEVANDMDPNILALMNFDGTIYGVPQGWNNALVHMNTKMLADAGLEVPGEDWTKDDFLSYCEKLSMDRPDGTRQYAIAVPNAYFTFSPWLFSNGGSYMNENFTKSNLLAPETVEVFTFWQELVQKGYAPVPEPNVDYTQQMIDGNVAMICAGRWTVPSYVTNNFSDVAVQYVPTFKEKRTVWGGGAVFTLASSRHPDEAADLGLYIASAEYASIYTDTGAIPVLNSVAKAAMEKLPYPLNSQLFYESAAVAKAVEAPSQYPELDSIMTRVFSEIFVNCDDVEASLAAADAEFNAILIENE